MVDPPLRPGLLERAQVLALDAGLGFRIIVTKRDRASKKDTLPELDPLRGQDVPIYETSALKEEGLEPLRGLLRGRVVVLLGHSGVGKSTLVNALHPQAALKTGPFARIPSFFVSPQEAPGTTSVHHIEYSLLPSAIKKAPSGLPAGLSA